MRAAFFKDINVVKFIDAPEPQITKPDDVKIKIMYTGICGSDILGLNGGHPTRKPPVISGHESSGVVMEVGSAVKDFKPGDRVAIEPQYSCQRCNACLSGRYNICPEKKVLGTIYWQGSFADYVIAPERTLLHIPESIDMKEAALLEPLAVGFHAVSMVEPRKKDTVVILGCGPIGIATELGCIDAGITQIFMTDKIDYNLGIAKEIGALDTINVERQDAEQKIKSLTNGDGADIIFIAAGAAEALDQAVRMVKPGGKVVIIAHFGKNVTWDPKSFRYKEALIYGTFMYTRNDYLKVIKAVESGSINLSSMITAVYPIEECVEVFEKAKNHSIDYVKLLFSFD